MQSNRFAAQYSATCNWPSTLAACQKFHMVGVILNSSLKEVL